MEHLNIIIGNLSRFATQSLKQTNICGVQLPDTWWLCSQWSADFPTSLHKQRWIRFLFSSDYDNSCFTRRCLSFKLTAILRYHKEANGRGVSWKSRITAHVIWSALIMVIKSSCVPVSFPANTWEQEKQHTPGSVDKTPCQTIIHHTVLIFFLFFLFFFFFCWSSASTLHLAALQCWLDALIWEPVLNDTGTCNERNVCPCRLFL